MRKRNRYKRTLPLESDEDDDDDFVTVTETKLPQKYPRVNLTFSPSVSTIIKPIGRNTSSIWSMTLFPIVQYHLWSFLTDSDVLNGMKCSYTSYQCLPFFTPRFRQFNMYLINKYQTVRPNIRWINLTTSLELNHRIFNESPVGSLHLTLPYRDYITPNPKNLFPTFPLSVNSIITSPYFNEELVIDSRSPSEFEDKRVERLRNSQLNRFIPDLLQPSLSSHLTSVSFGNQFNSPLHAGVLPCSLTYLYLGINFNQQLPPHVFPQTLICLEFGQKFNHQIHINVLPRNLQILVFGKCFNHKFLPGVLPQSLIELMLGIDYDQPFLEHVLPSSIQKVVATRLSVENYNLSIIPKDCNFFSFESSSHKL